MCIDLDTEKVEKRNAQLHQVCNAVFGKCLHVPRQLGIIPKTWNSRALEKVTEMKIVFEKLDWKVVRTPVVSQMSGKPWGLLLISLEYFRGGELKDN